MISINVFTPIFRSARDCPAMLPERSRMSTMSVGLLTISGAAVMPMVTSRVPLQGMAVIPPIDLLELIIPISSNTSSTLI